jgi:hypothetical protein
VITRITKLESCEQTNTVTLQSYTWIIWISTLAIIWFCILVCKKREKKRHHGVLMSSIRPGKRYIQSTGNSYSMRLEVSVNSLDTDI